MKTKYLQFIKARKQNPKTAIYLVRTNNFQSILLGQIRWYAQWRQYGFYPEGKTVFEKICLMDIHNFLIKLNHKQRRKSNK